MVSGESIRYESSMAGTDHVVIIELIDGDGDDGE